MEIVSISGSRPKRCTRRLKSLLLALCLAAPGLLSAGLWVLPAGGAEGADGAVGMPGDESCLVSRINGERRGAGLPSLEVHSGLASIARRYSTYMAENMAPRTWVHNSNLPNELPSGWKTRGENVGWATDCGSMHSFFINSPPHRKNILGAQFNYVGVGVVRDAQGDLRVTEVFMGAGEQVTADSVPQTELTPPVPSGAKVSPGAAKPVAPAAKTPSPKESVKPGSPTVAKRAPAPLRTRQSKTRAYMDVLEKEPEAEEVSAASRTNEVSFLLDELDDQGPGTSRHEVTFSLR